MNKKLERKDKEDKKFEEMKRLKESYDKKSFEQYLDHNSDIAHVTQELDQDTGVGLFSPRIETEPDYVNVGIYSCRNRMTQSINKIHNTISNK